MNKELRHLLNKLNRVTSCHRHGRGIPDSYLDDLADAQVEYEQREDRDAHDELDNISQTIKDIRDGVTSTKVEIEKCGDLTLVKFRTTYTDPHSIT